MIVSPDGPLDAPLIIIEPSPDSHAERTGRPLTSGPAGFYLNRALRKAGLDRRKDCLVTSVVGTRPANDVWGRHAPEAKNQGIVSLKTVLASNFSIRGQRSPPLLLALGEQARQLLLSGDPDSKPPKKQTIFETRGYPFRLHEGFYKSLLPEQQHTRLMNCGEIEQSTGNSVSPSKTPPTLTTIGLQQNCPQQEQMLPQTEASLCLATVHPASFLFGGWIPFAPLFEWDIKKAARWIAGERPGPRAERVVRTLDDLQWLEHACLRAERLAIDIEESAVIGLAWSAELGCAVPDYTREPARSFVERILSSPVPKITQNGAEGLYDHTRLRAYGFDPQTFAYDLMLMWHAIEPLLAGKRKEENGGRTEKSLRFFASLFTWEEFWKSYLFESPEEEWTLCAKDARITFEVCSQLLGRMT